MSTDTPAEIYLRTGEFYFGGGRIRVRTVLGTCIAIVLWHPHLRIGGMCHYMLPARIGARDATTPTGLYAQDAMQLFARALAATGTGPGDYVVKIFGGGRMFAGEQSLRLCPPRDACAPRERTQCPEVGCKNVQASHELLAGAGFHVAAEDVGGIGSRQVVFDIWSGDVWVRRGEPLRVGPKSGTAIS